MTRLSRDLIEKYIKEPNEDKEQVALETRTLDEASVVDRKP